MESPSPRAEALAYLREALNDPAAEFRDGQWDAVESIVLRRERLLVVQRTGWGKSYVYFLATRMLRNRGSGPTLLISPLLSLMRNQITAASRLNIIAESINSDNKDDWESIVSKLLGNSVDVLLVSPERLANDDFVKNVLSRVANHIGLFVVDEAHCISDWGHDFRPDYRRITRVLNALPTSVPVLATTATANNRVVNDVHAQLGPSLKIVRGPLVRTSLRLQNISLPSHAARMAWLAGIVPRIPGSGIIYTLTIRDAVRVADWLRTQGIEAYYYYGGMEASERQSLEQRLIDNEIKALVATTALSMGFDKPDLGFVIHYQRPASVVHYYQQVGRAGRAIKNAYGILLCGSEDQEITDYFINTAFPPHAHVKEVLGVLESAPSGLTAGEMLWKTNLTRGQIEKVLKLLAVESPSPITRIDRKWFRSPIQYSLDTVKIQELIGIRQAEQARMAEYVKTDRCLMSFLAKELDDPNVADCGRCASCAGKPIAPETYSTETAAKAAAFLRNVDEEITPRKMWPSCLEIDGFKGRIDGESRAEPGRALCLWGDAGWGDLVVRGKHEGPVFDARLVDAAVEMIWSRWKPEPFPAWVTCVPSLNKPSLVPNLAERIAERLKIPFSPCIVKCRQTPAQKLMNNSYQQVNNIISAFTLDSDKVSAGPVLLVDDVVDSGWTFTLLSALLRRAGSGPVFPMALAKVSVSTND